MGGDAEIIFVFGEVVKELRACGEFEGNGFINQGLDISFAEFGEVMVAIQGSVVGIGRFDVGDDAGAAVIVVGWEEGSHLGGGGLGEVVVVGPEGGWEDELRVES